MTAIKDTISPAEIVKLYPATEGKLHYYAVTESTNTKAKELAREGCAHGTVLIADCQTGGRGRMGRRFHSAPHSGIYMSIILKPKASLPDILSVTAMAAVSVAEAAEAVGSAPLRIKWVNDVYKNEKKVCGILTEGVFAPDGKSLSHLVLGIGVNVYLPFGGFPPDVASIADAVFSAPCVGLRSRFAAEILKRVDFYAEHLEEKLFLDAYRARDMLFGRKVEVIRGLANFPATVCGIGDDFSLKIRLEDGTTTTLTSGEVSIRF